MRKIFFTFVFALLSASYSFTWHPSYTLSSPYYTDKPFVYRALVPALSGSTGLSIEVIVLLFCIALGMTMLAIYEKHWRQSFWNDILLIVSFSTTVLVLELYKKTYDIPTAFFFTLIIHLWMEKKYLLSIPVFILSCLNRETTAILIPVFIVLHRNALVAVAYSVSWGFVKFIMVIAFGDSGGRTVYIRPLNNIISYISNPYWSIILIATTAILLILFLMNKPKTFNYILLLFPILLGMHVIAGAPFEIRVFAEIMPILFMGAFLKGGVSEKIKEEVEKVPPMQGYKENLISRRGVGRCGNIRYIQK